MDLMQLREELLSLRKGVILAYDKDRVIIGAALAETLSLISTAKKLLPEHKVYFKSFIRYCLISNADIKGEGVPSDALSMPSVRAFCTHVIQMIDYELKTKKAIAEGKLFLSAKEKMKEAADSFSKGDKAGVFNNLNTAVELMLKEKLNIPIVLKDINTARILDVLIAEGLGPVDYLRATKTHLFLGNKVKHLAFNPPIEQCVSALGSVEELNRELENANITLSAQVKEKIFTVKNLSQPKKD